MNYKQAWLEVHHAIENIIIHLNNGEVLRFPGHLTDGSPSSFGTKREYFWFDDHLEIQTYRLKSDGGAYKKIILKQEFIDLTDVARVEFELAKYE